MAAVIGGPVVGSPSAAGASGMDRRMVDICVVAAEKRREGGKHYVYELNIYFEGSEEVGGWHCRHGWLAGGMVSDTIGWVGWEPEPRVAGGYVDCWVILWMGEASMAFMWIRG